MNTDWNGRPINEFTMSNGKSRCDSTGSCPKLYLSATHHGDRDEFWIIEEPCGGGKEIARYNMRFVEDIKWDLRFEHMEALSGD